MDNTTLLALLHAARALLAKTYIPWRTDDGQGGHCHMGVVEEITNLPIFVLCPAVFCPVVFRSELSHPLVRLIDDACERLYPELKGQRRLRADRPEMAFFDYSPGVFVNNHLGKEAILAAYDDAITTLEVAVLVEREAQSANAGESIPVNDGREEHQRIERIISEELLVK